MEIKYIVETDFSRVNATAIRVLGCSNALVYNNPDNNVEIIGFGNTPELKIENFKVFSVKRGTNMVSKIMNNLLRPWLLLSKLKSLNKPDVIIFYAVYGNSSKTISLLHEYCKKNKIRLYIDVTEIYETKNLLFGKYGRVGRDLLKTINKDIYLSDGVIAISTYIENLFLNKLNVIRIPQMVDTTVSLDNDTINNFDKEYLNLVFAGTYHKKEALETVADVVDDLYRKGYKVKLSIIGETKTNFEKKTNKKFSEGIVFFGRIPQNNVFKYIANADFSILIRPISINTTAGFPTKFVESLNAGTPVIANLTSDLGLYLKNDFNGFVVKDDSKEEIRKRIISILELPKSKIEEMKLNAKKTAIENFDYRGYSNKIQSFIN